MIDHTQREKDRVAERARDFKEWWAAVGVCLASAPMVEAEGYAKLVFESVTSRMTRLLDELELHFYVVRRPRKDGHCGEYEWDVWHGKHRLCSCDVSEEAYGLAALLNGEG